MGHLDADCFYVSAERVRDAFLRGKPVGVLGNQGACVIAKSYEMKAAGVETGMPIWEALVKCPTGVYVKRDFRWYEVLSRLMLDVVRELSPRVEYYSIDEFFFLARAAARAGRSRSWPRRSATGSGSGCGVPVTVGIARTRTLAKLISDTAKPFGALAVLDREAEATLLADRPVTEITGIAGRRAAAAPALGHPDLPGPGPRRPPAGPVAADGHGRGPLVGAQRRPGAADPPRAPAAQGPVARAGASASRPPTRSSSTPGWSATSSG